MKRQTGASLVTTMLLAVLGTAALVFTIKLMPFYTDNVTMESVFASLQEEYVNEELTRSQIRERIEKRFIINNIDGFLEYVDVYGQGSEIVIEMNYERRTSFMYNIELVASFNHYVVVSE